MESAAIACALEAAEYKARLAWIQRLNAAALRDYSRDGSRIELTYDRSAIVRVREFVRREQHCCPFLQFTTRDEKDSLLVVIEVPEIRAELADALFGGYTDTGTPAT